MTTRPATRTMGWAVWAVLAFALLLRGVFYSGFFGSDEVTYVEWAYKLLDGDWTVSDYVGANRYGVNLPIAGFSWILGRNEFGAAAYSMVCALCEVALVATVGQRLIGERAALMAALVLACLPTHVHLAGRLMADAPLTLAMTASFLCFFDGELRGKTVSYLIAGAAAGFSFWIKPAAVLYLAVFLLYPLYVRRIDLRWGWMILGFAAVVLANNLLFLALTGDWLANFKFMAARHTSGYLESGTAAGAMRDDPTYYLQHLFVRIHHTWLLGPLAALGGLMWLLRPRQAASKASDRGMKLVMFWSIALVAVLSLFIVSTRPITFVPKQTNYMLMFAAPLAMLAGHGLSRWHGLRLLAALALIVVPSVVLAGLHQATVHVFTAHSKAAVAYVQAHPGPTYFANTNVHRAATFHNLVKPGEPAVPIGAMDDLKTVAAAAARGSPEVRVILDQTTLSWAGSEPIRRLDDAPACWKRLDTLQGTGYGLGWTMLGRFIAVVDRLPGVVASRLGPPLRKIHSPEPAIVYTVPPGCR